MSLLYLVPFCVLLFGGVILIESINQDSRHDFCLEKGFDIVSDDPTSYFYCEKIKWYCEGEICVKDGYTSKEFRDREYEVWKIKKKSKWRHLV